MKSGRLAASRIAAGIVPGVFGRGSQAAFCIDAVSFGTMPPISSEGDCPGRSPLWVAVALD